MDRTACTEPQRLYKGALYLTLPLELSKPLNADVGLTLNFEMVSQSSFEDQYSNDVRNAECAMVLSKRSSYQSRMFLHTLTF